MKKMILVGRSECGKTTLRQALKGDTIQYEKTQYVNHFDVIIDTPGEYAETNTLARALALYSYEADVVALLINATEPYSLYPPNGAPAGKELYVFTHIRPVFTPRATRMARLRSFVHTPPARP